MAAPTSLTVSIDALEYSRFESDRNTITATVVPQGAGTSGEQITISILKARRDRTEEVATKTITLTTNPTATTTFYLPDIIDVNMASKVRRGLYFVRAYSVTDPSVINTSPDFYISLITIENFIASFLFGLSMRAFETVSNHNQPSNITGVTITYVSVPHSAGWYNLSLIIQGTNKYLKWGCGLQVNVTNGGVFLLRRSTEPQVLDYIEVTVFASSLPSTPQVDQILIEKSLFGKDKIRQEIERAISWVEDEELCIFLEPTNITTEISPVSLSYPAGGDILQVSDIFDKIVTPLSYYQPTAGHWINFRMPYYPVIQFYELFGKMGNVRIVDIAPEWIQVHNAGGFVELVPFNQQTLFNFIGLVWVESIRQGIPLPSFWNFKALVGFRELPKILIDLVGRKAAVSVLTYLGQAYRGGVVSDSISRDGVSQSRSYMTNAQFGAFTGAINNHLKWIQDNLQHVKGAFCGSRMQVV